MLSSEPLLQAGQGMEEEEEDQERERDLREG